jgi:hypothetical protein
MASKPKTSVNPLHAALPQLFKRSGEPKRIKGQRANRDVFNRAMRFQKTFGKMQAALKEGVVIITPTMSIIPSRELVELMEREEAFGALILNGYEVTFIENTETHEAMQAYRLERGFDKLAQDEMFDEELA